MSATVSPCPANEGSVTDHLAHVPLMFTAPALRDTNKPLSRPLCQGLIRSLLQVDGGKCVSQEAMQIPLLSRQLHLTWSDIDITLMLFHTQLLLVSRNGLHIRHMQAGNKCRHGKPRVCAGGSVGQQGVRHCSTSTFDLSPGFFDPSEKLHSQLHRSTSALPGRA